MISVEEALQNILENICILEPETVKIVDALQRVLAEDIYSDIDVPPFDNSAMDGYAVRSIDIQEASKEQPVELEIIEDVPAGKVPKRRVGQGQATRIMTGAPIPDGADCVIMVEYTEEEDNRVWILRPGARRKSVPLYENIRKAGEDMKKGAMVLSKGCLMRPAEVGICASVGRSSVKVIRRPKVAILSTGDELVDVGQPLSEGKIRNVNTYTLITQVMRYGGIPIDLGITPDIPEIIEKKISEGLSADMILVSAGISVGDHDLVKDVLASLGMEMKFWKVAMKPGKPLAFGIIDSKPVFGLPGNPVSSMVSFEQFVRPAILKMSAKTRLKKPVVEAILEQDIRKKPGRRHYLRAWIESVNGAYRARVTGPQGAGILTSMMLSNGLIIVPEDTNFIPAGQRVAVQLLDQLEVD